MMQQIGDSIFWLNNNNNNKITEKLAEEGIVDAANQIASKQIRPVLAHITEEEYIDILIKITKLGYEFKKSELQSCLDNDENESIGVFLNDMVDLIVFTDVGCNGKIFKFSNRLFYTYFLIRSIDKG